MNKKISTISKASKNKARSFFSAIRFFGVKRNRRMIFLFLAATLLCVFSLACVLSLEVQSKSKVRELFDNSSFADREQEYKDEVRQILHDYNLSETGMMLTYTQDISGNRRYLLKLHDHRFAYLEDDTYSLLIQSLTSLELLDFQNNPYEIEIVLSM